MRHDPIITPRTCSQLVTHRRCAVAQQSYFGHSLTLLPSGRNKNQWTMAVEAYCVKCKAKREMKDPKENTMANGRKAMKGTCPTCGTGMFKIMGNK